MREVLFIVVALFAVACSGLPKDQSDATRQITATGKMRIGLMENPPWVIRMGDEPSGAEVALLREFASTLNAQPEWHWGSDESLFGALELHQLDAVIGGITDNTPWTTRVGVTRYYFTEQFDVAAPPNSKIDSLDGAIIGVTDLRIAGLVEHEGGSPVRTIKLDDFAGPIAAANWQIRKLGRVPADLNLQTDKHVIAVPPGENQLVKRLEEFLSSKHDDIPVMLAAQPEVTR